VLKELGRDILVCPPILSQLESNVEHAQAVECHPASAVGLLQDTAGRKRLGAVKDADIVEAEETSLEQILAFHVLSINPPGKVHQQLLEHALEEVEVLSTVNLPFYLEYTEGSPRVHRGIDVFVVPFIAVDVRNEVRT
jgi:hypothetical protein